MMKKASAILLRISASERYVSSKPGVSMRMTFRPATLNGGVIVTPVVHDTRESPTSKDDPLARLTN